MPASIATTATDNGTAWSIVASVKDQYGKRHHHFPGLEHYKNYRQRRRHSAGQWQYGRKRQQFHLHLYRRHCWTPINIEFTLSQGDYYAYGQALLQL